MKRLQVRSNSSIIWPSWIIHRNLLYICMIYGARLEEHLDKDREVDQGKNEKPSQITILKVLSSTLGVKKLSRKIPVSDFYPPGYKSSKGEFFIEIFREEDETIIGQYIAFYHLFDEQRDLKFKKGTRGAVKVLNEIIRICKERNILVDFWNTREVGYKMRLLDPETIEEMFTNLPSEIDQLRDEIKIKDEQLSIKDEQLFEKDETIKERGEDGANMLKQLVQEGHISSETAKKLAYQYKFPWIS